MTWGFLAITLSLAPFPCVQLAWPFVTDGWFEAFGSISHVGPDAKAQDWLRSAHHGATRGEPVLAPMNGSIVQAEWSCSSYGKTVVIANADYQVRIAHLEEISVHVGEYAHRGETVLGLLGRTGPAPRCEAGILAAPREAHLHISAMSAWQAGPIRPLCISWIEPNVRRAGGTRGR